MPVQYYIMKYFLILDQSGKFRHNFKYANLGGWGDNSYIKKKTNTHIVIHDTENQEWTERPKSDQQGKKVNSYHIGLKHVVRQFEIPTMCQVLT